MPPHRVAVLRTLAPNSLSLSRSSHPPRSTHPQLSPWSSFSLAARSHTPRAHRAFLDETFPARRDMPLHHYYSTIVTTTVNATRHRCRRRRPCYHYHYPSRSPSALPRFTSSNPTMCCLRRVSAELPSSFQIQSPLSPPFSSFHSDSLPSPAQSVPPFPPHISCVRASFSTSPSSFVQLFPPNPTAARVDDDVTAT